MSNKIKYNLKNVYAAIMTHTEDGGYSYETPVPIPGAVNLSLDAEGDTSPFYADGVVYFRAVSNNGYSGDLEIALVLDWFREKILKEVKDNNGVLIETNTDIEPVYFALLFEFDGDKKAIRHVMYNCSVSSRPTVEGKTKEEYVEEELAKLTVDKAESDEDIVNYYQKDSNSLDEEVSEFLFNAKDDGKAATLKADDRVYIIARIDVTTRTEWLESSRSSLLLNFKGSDYEDYLDAFSANLSVNANSYLVDTKYKPERLENTSMTL